MTAPLIDKRGFQEILKHIRALAPFYTPEWNALEEKDSGAALLKIFAQMHAGTIGRLNQVPDKNFIAFLNMLGLTLLPGVQAHAPVTFNLSTGTTDPVLIPAGTQIASAPDKGGEPVLFETEKNMLATPAKLIDAFSLNVRDDCIYQAPAGMMEGKQLLPFSGTVTGVDEASRSLFLPDTAGLEKGDILKIGRKYTEISQVTDTKVVLAQKLAHDRNLVDTPIERVTQFELFTGKNRQEHILYLGHNELFTMKSRTQIRLDISGANLSLLAQTAGGKWQYWHEDWIDVSVDNSSCCHNNRLYLVLEKKDEKEIKESEINQIKSRWIRFVADPLYIEEFEMMEIDSIEVAVTSLDQNDPDLIFFQDVLLNSKDFYPFGQQPRTFDAFYIASQEALSKKGSTICITFSVEHVPLVTPKTSNLPHITAQLSWEYWNGQGWIRLPQNGAGNNENFNPEGTRNLTFTCPGNLAQAAVNGQKNYWIRIRIASGDYGQMEFDSTTNTLSPRFLLPKIKNMTISYESASEASYLQRCLTRNNLEYRDRSEESRPFGNRFSPFYRMADNHQALYLGFDQPPLKGPVSLYFSLDEQEYSPDKKPRVEWEYFREQTGAGEWSRLEVLDETIGLTQSGSVQFIGPVDFAQASFFGKKLYWIRAVDAKDKFQPWEKSVETFIRNNRKAIRDGTIRLHPRLWRIMRSLKGIEVFPPNRLLAPFHPRFSVPAVVRANPPAPKIKGMYLNTTTAIQAETIKNEILGSSNGTASQSFRLAKYPVIVEQIYVNELRAWSEGERKELIESNRFEIHESKDENGNAKEFWIKWTPVDDLTESAASDRHYEIDRTFGQIRFGDGVHGAVPPIGADSIKADYQSGGGSKGNVGPKDIKIVQTSIASVDRVTNPEAADGGCDTESVEQALKRGSQLLKHRNRAIAPEDYENLARQSSRSIARVKCLPNFNGDGLFEPGWVAVLIVPQSKAIQPKPSARLKRQTEKYLSERASNVVVPRHFLVTGPCYAEVSIHAKLLATSIDAVPLAEQEAMKKLREFLHPLSGGWAGQGWDFGSSPCFSDLYALLEAVEGVDHVQKLSMALSDNEGVNIEVTSDQTADVKLPPYALIYSGRHQVVVKGLIM